jgi:hypothetical protein
LSSSEKRSPLLARLAANCGSSGGPALSGFSASEVVSGKRLSWIKVVVGQFKLTHYHQGCWIGETIPGYEAMHMIRKGQGRWLLKGDVGRQVRFINSTLGLKTV